MERHLSLCALNESPEQRQEALKKMADWISAIADHIRNPVFGLSMALQILSKQMREEKSESETVQQTLSKMKQRLSYLNEYLEELVDFTKPVTLNVESVSMEVLVRDLKLESHHAFPFPHDYVLEFHKGAEYVDADRHRMRTVLKALVFNGIEASCCHDVPAIRIKTACKTVGPNMGIEIQVEDNGPGFSKLHSDLLFEPFFTTKEAGTGLGLSLVQKYMSAHRGTVSLGRGAGLGGALVTLFFPSRRPEYRDLA